MILYSCHWRGYSVKCEKIDTKVLTFWCTLSLGSRQSSVVVYKKLHTGGWKCCRTFLHHVNLCKKKNKKYRRLMSCSLRKLYGQISSSSSNFLALRDSMWLPKIGLYYVSRWVLVSLNGFHDLSGAIYVWWWKHISNVLSETRRDEGPVSVYNKFCISLQLCRHYLSTSPFFELRFLQ